MGEYALDLFGKYGGKDIQSIVDRAGNYWFTEQTIAEALGEAQHHVAYIRQNHPGEFDEGTHYTSLVIDGKRRLVYSEEGFLVICDMSKSVEAYRLRKWARNQFRVKQRDGQVLVQAKASARDDLSDLGSDLVILQQMLDTLAEDRRRIVRIEREQAANEIEVGALKERASDTEVRIATLEGRAKVKAGEMTAIQLAQHCGWMTDKGSVHNPAVVLAAINADFLGRRLMHRRQELDSNNRPVEVNVFTPEGVAAFLHEIDANYSSGDEFEIAPNAIAAQRGLKNRRYVRKL